MPLNLSVNEWICRARTNLANFIELFRYGPLADVELEEAARKAGRWLWVLSQSEQLELQFWQFMVALRSEDPFLTRWFLHQFSSVVRDWSLSLGIDELQRRLSFFMLLDEVRCIWERCITLPRAVRECHQIRATLGDQTLLSEILHDTGLSGAKDHYPQCLAFLGTVDAIHLLHDLAKHHIGEFVGESAEKHLAILGKQGTSVSMRMRTQEHYVDLEKVMALATSGESAAIEDLVNLLNTTSNEFLEAPFKGNPILVSIAPQIGPMRNWLQKGVSLGRLVFPERTVQRQDFS
jgi:hypothetical protein